MSVSSTIGTCLKKNKMDDSECKNILDEFIDKFFNYITNSIEQKSKIYKHIKINKYLDEILKKHIKCRSILDN